MSDTTLALRFRYPYEEFADNIKAMRMVRHWEDTSRFGHLGTAQTSRANSARVLEFFLDSCPDQKEAVYKAEVFLLICDYLARHTPIFARKGMVDLEEGSVISAEPALLRAVHYLFTAGARPPITHPKKVLSLARALNVVSHAA